MSSLTYKKLISEQKDIVLESIINCQSLKDLNPIFTSPESEYLLSGAFYQNYLKPQKNYSLILTLMNSLDISSPPIDLFWTIISFVSLSVAALWVAGFVALMAVGLFVGGLFYYHYINKKNNTQNKEWLKLMIIKSHALDELLKRYQPVGWQYAPMQEERTLHNISKKAAVKLGVTVTILLTMTFYWGITDSLLTLGVLSSASLLAGPIGLAIAMSVAIVIGVIVAIKYYQISKAKALISNVKNNFQDEFTYKKTVLGGFKQFKTLEKKPVTATDSHDFPKSQPLLQTIPSLKKSASCHLFRSMSSPSIAKSTIEDTNHSKKFSC